MSRRHGSLLTDDNFLRLNRPDEGKDGAREDAPAGLKALTLIDRYVSMRLSLFLIP
jgi:hypothetical protein